MTLSRKTRACNEIKVETTEVSILYLLPQAHANAAAQYSMSEVVRSPVRGRTSDTIRQACYVSAGFSILRTDPPRFSSIHRFTLWKDAEHHSDIHHWPNFVFTD